MVGYCNSPYLTKMTVENIKSSEKTWQFAEIVVTLHPLFVALCPKQLEININK